MESGVPFSLPICQGLALVARQMRRLWLKEVKEVLQGPTKEAGLRHTCPGLDVLATRATHHVTTAGESNVLAFSSAVPDYLKGLLFCLTSPFVRLGT